MQTWRNQLSISGAALLLAGCAVGPDYERPEIDVGAQYAYATVADTAAEPSAWQPVLPFEVKGAEQWWLLFQEPQLNAWLLQLQAANLSLEQAEARYRQAQASLGQAQASFFPTLGTSASGQRSGSGQSSPQNQYNLNLNASWEPDLWGRVRRSVEAAEASLEASAADVLATRLSIESTFVQSYFQAKYVLAAQQLYDQTIAAYERSLQNNINRFEVGLVSSADVASAQAQLDNARTQRLALNRQWGQLRNAMAVLLGQPPAAFDLILEQSSAEAVLPTIPVGVPVQLLVRRPDVAAAERRVAAANAQIGVAQSAWLPNLTLSAQGGYSSGSWSDWISAPARFWSLGPALAFTVFDGGARTARVNEAIATYDVQAATYKQTVLEALREVEDNLVQWHGLQQEFISQQNALAAARESLRLTRNQFDAGMIDYLAVAQVETNALSTERATLALQNDLFITATQLISALGGRWD